MAETHIQLNPDGTTSIRKTVLWPSSKSGQEEVIRSLFNRNGWTVDSLENQMGSYWKLSVKNPTETLNINLYISSIRDESRQPDEFKMQLGSTYPTSEVPGWINLVLGIYVISDNEGETCQYILAGYDNSAYDFSGNPSIRGTRTNGLQKAFIWGLYSTKRSVLFRPDFLYYYIEKQKSKPEGYPSQSSLDSLDLPLQQIFYGAPGTGKSHTINAMCSRYENYRTTFHPDSDYASFVGSYKPITQKTFVRDSTGRVVEEGGRKVTESRIVYRYVFQAFLKAYIAAWREQQNENPAPVFLIVEEINRGNCAQIFGDIFQLLDRNEAGYSDYPIVADDDLAQELKEQFSEFDIPNAEGINALYEGGQDVMGQVMAGERLLLPNNLYIWATMNTSDQSLFPIDSAFKRRWDWNYIKIKNAGKNFRIQFANGNAYDWWQFVEAINKRIEGGEIQQEDKKLGYFFAKAKEGVIPAATFLSKVIFFLYNDVLKDFGLDEDFLKDENGETMTFASYFDEDGRINESQVECFITNLGLEPLDSEEETAEGEGLDGVQYIVNGKKRNRISSMVRGILNVAAPKHTYDELKAAIDTVLHRETPIIKPVDPETYEKEDRWNPQTITSKDGVNFVLTTMWQKKYIPRIKALAEHFGVPFEERT